MHLSFSIYTVLLEEDYNQSVLGAFGTSKMDEKLTVTEVYWGRKSAASWGNSLGGLLLILATPLLVLTNWIALEHFDASLSTTIRTGLSHGLYQFSSSHMPQFSGYAALGYAVWLIFQGLLYHYLPGPTCYGQRTPGGNLLQYTTNGLGAWMITHILATALIAVKWIDPAVIANNWQGLLIAANIYGYLLAIVAMVKGYVAPSHPNDRKFSGECILFLEERLVQD